MSGHRSTLQGEAGMTLVEIIVVVLVGGLLMSVIAGLFVNGLTSQQQTAARDRATGQAAVVQEVLATAIRNSGALRLSEGGARLDAAVLEKDGSWQCRAWVLDGPDLRYRSDAGPLGADFSDWAVIASPASGSLAGDVPFALIGTRGLDVGLSFIGASGVIAQELRTTITGQGHATSGAPAC